MLVSAGCAGVAQATPSIVGFWQVKFTTEPNLTPYATMGVCFLANNTWYSSSQLWNGNWNQQGNEIKWYGTAPIYYNGSTAQIATVAFGELHSTGTMSAQYAEWNVPGTPPLFWDRHYAMDLTYQSPTCPAPSTLQGG